MNNTSLKEALLSAEADIQKIELECKSRSDEVKSYAMALAYDVFAKIGWASWSLDDHCKSGQYERLNKGLSDKNIKVVNIDFENACGTVLGSELYNVSNDGCSCYDFATRHLPCKHMYCVADRLLTKNKTVETIIEKSLEIIKPIEQSESNEQLKTFAVSGTMASMPREEIERYIRIHGGKVTSSVSKKTDYLVTGIDAAGSKLLRAKELGVRIISEDELISLFEQK